MLIWQANGLVIREHVGPGSKNCYSVITGISVSYPPDEFRTDIATLYIYEPYEVEHVTCASHAEQVAPNGALPR